MWTVRRARNTAIQPSTMPRIPLAAWDDEGMTWTAYLDESKRKDYLLCAVVVPAAETNRIRAALKKAKGPRRELHMSKVEPHKRLPLAQMVTGLGVQAYMFTSRGSGSERIHRDIVLGAAVPHLVDQGCGELVIESSPMDPGDRQRIHGLLGPGHAMRYRHDTKAELLLALPDIFAWSWGYGGKFKAAVKPAVIDFGPFRD